MEQRAYILTKEGNDYFTAEKVFDTKDQAQDWLDSNLRLYEPVIHVGIYDNYKDIDWEKYCLKSTYNSRAFYVKVNSVLIAQPSGFDDDRLELCFDCQCFDGQGYKVEREYMRASLVGRLYEIASIPKHLKQEYKQLDLFEVLGI